MFVLTMGKNALRRAGAAIACMACIAGVPAAADRLGGGTVTAWGVAYSLVFTAAALVLGVVLFSRIEKTFMDTV